MNNFVQFILAVCSGFSVAVTTGVIMGIVINFKTRERIQSDTTDENNTSKLSEVTYATEGNWKKSKQKDRTKEERAEHNARVLRQYRIKG